MRSLPVLSLAVLIAACEPAQIGAPASGTAPAQTAAESSPAPNDVSRTPDGRPDLSGIWQSLSAANWNLETHVASQGATEVLGAIGAVPPGLGVVEGGTIPYLPSALAQRDSNFANRRTDDPEAKCFRPGVPRATYMPQPFQIFQTPGEIFIAYQYAKASRSIFLDEHVDIPVDSWMGWSNGRWDGDTLMVEVTNQNGQTWLDRAGNFASANAVVTERFTPEGRNHIWYEATIDDPSVYERPWTIAMMLYRVLDHEYPQLLEFKCVEFAEDLMYGHLDKPAAQSEGDSADE